MISPLPLIAFSLISLSCFSQLNSHRDTINLSENPKNNIYILDSTKSYKSIEVLKLDEPDCYLQIIDGYSVLSFRFRGNNRFVSGKIYNPEIVINEGDTIRAFTIISDNNYPNTNSNSTSTFRKKTYLGIKENKNSKPTVYILNTRYQIEELFISHKATTEELKDLYAKSADQN